MSEGSVAVPTPTSEVGAVARIPGVLFSPTKTFESIARRPTWLAPLILWTAFSLVVTAVILPRVDYDHLIRSSFERRGQTVPEDRIQSIVETQKRIAPMIYGGIAAVTPTAISLLVALVFWGAFKAFGWDTTFRQSFGATTHSFVPGVLASLLLLPILIAQGNGRSAEPGRHAAIEPRVSGRARLLQGAPLRAAVDRPLLVLVAGAPGPRVLGGGEGLAQVGGGSHPDDSGCSSSRSRAASRRCFEGAARDRRAERPQPGAAFVV